MSTKQFPDIGTKLTCTPADKDEPVVNVELTRMIGAARLYEVTLVDDCGDCDAGDVAIFAIQPSGKWWMIRDFRGEDYLLHGDG